MIRPTRHHPAAAVALVAMAVLVAGLGLDARESDARKNKDRRSREPGPVASDGPTLAAASLLPAPPATVLPDSGPTMMPTEPSEPAGPTFVVPDSIDHTGMTDASDALNAFIAEVPDGSTIIFPSGSVYLLQHTGIKLAGRTGLRLIGEDVALLLQTSGDGTDSAAFWLSNLGDVTTSGIEIAGFLVVGENVAAGTTEAYSGREGVTGLWTGRGTRDVVLRDNVFRDLYGHGVLLTDDSTGNWTSQVSIHDNVFDGMGTMGLAIVAARDVLIEDNSVFDVGWSAIDIEPEDDRQGAERVEIRRNVFSAYGWNTGSSNWWLAMVPDDEGLGSVAKDIVVESNVVTVGPATGDNGNQDGVGGLAIRADKSNPKSGIVIRSNRSLDDDTRDVDRAVMNFSDVDGLTVEFNRQAISGASDLVRCDRCSGVTIRANDTSPGG